MHNQRKERSLSLGEHLNIYICYLYYEEYLKVFNIGVKL